MKKVLLVIIFTIYCYSDYVAFDLNKGWNALSSSYGISNLSNVDPACVSHYTLLSSGRFQTYDTSKSELAPKSITNNGGFLLYSSKGDCKVHLKTLSGVAFRGKEKLVVNKGWNLRGSSHKMNNIGESNKTCISHVAVLSGATFMPFFLGDLNETEGDKKDKTPPPRVTTGYNAGALFKGRNNCDFTISVTPGSGSKAHRNTPSAPLATLGKIEKPRKNILHTFEDARDYFKNNCYMCHSLNDSRLHKNDVYNLENILLSYRYFYKTKPQAMVDYLSPLSDTDIRVLTNYITKLYNYSNQPDTPTK